VADYWERHTVPAPTFESAEASLRQLQERFSQYPLFGELMAMADSHEGEVVLDYGCGPGNDVVHFLVQSRAARIVGVDVSAHALALARRRIELHGDPEDRIALLQTDEHDPTVSVADASIDYLHCGGVLHHTTDPQSILSEFHRVMRPGAGGRIMVYNRESTFFHLYVAYYQMVRTGVLAGLTAEEAFRRSTDGPDCPISRCYRPEEFVAMCDAARLEASFVGGYPGSLELEIIASDLRRARRSRRLGAEHRTFLRALTTDDRGYPMSGGEYAGVGGVYAIRRR